MEVFRISGGKQISGQVKVSGSKNSALPLFAASLLTEEECVLENIPDLSDIQFMAEIIRDLGADIEKIDSNTWKINPKEIVHYAPYELVRKMRASICLLGPLCARLGRAEIPMPGGCVIGNRPIDLHLRALKGLSAKVELKGGVVRIDAKNLKGEGIFLGGRHGSTVTGTANAIMAASLAKGTTTLEGCACEPEIVDLCNMLIKMGANIDGLGSHRIQIEGVDRLKGCHHRVISDRIETATYIIAAVITNGKIRIEDADLQHLGAFVEVMNQCGVELEENTKTNISVKVSSSGLQPFEIITLPYPGFPTDLQAQMTALASVVPGLSILTERVYPSRFMHVPELLRMGAEISLEGSSAIVQGVKMLKGAPVMASDLRASAALILAGLAAQDETWVQRIYHLDRGYDKFDSKLQSLGAEVERLSEDSLPKSFTPYFDSI
ncbi:MAG: UDP-N-acetylglucosamine 1-carboxyvinyltransferase [Verrucomicrobiota bacterium]|nr:UDP-N-acetylglucosamine 1-carboxyvinyltransferase [Verrucomicrobiota bacterium]